MTNQNAVISSKQTSDDLTVTPAILCETYPLHAHHASGVESYFYPEALAYNVWIYLKARKQKKATTHMLTHLIEWAKADGWENVKGGEDIEHIERLRYSLLTLSDPCLSQRHRKAMIEILSLQYGMYKGYELLQTMLANAREAA